MEVRLSNRARHSEPRRDEEQGGKRDPERAGDTEDDRCSRLNSPGDEKQGGTPPATLRCHAHDLIPDDRRQGDGGRDDPDDPDRV